MCCVFQAFRARRGLPLAVLVLALATGAAAQEVVVQNDSLGDGEVGAIQLGFVADERAAAWLTSPCHGAVTALQFYWASGLGSSGDTLQDAVELWRAGAFPEPGAQEVELLGPVLTDRAINEITLPLPVTVAESETVVASLRFIMSPLLNGGASVVTDVDGCKGQRNAIHALDNGFVWTDACSFGLSGDFVIRAVIDCAEVIVADDFESGGYDAWDEVVGGL